MNIAAKAAYFAAVAHGDQKRKYTGLPYIVHPLEVGHILSAFGYNDYAIAAGILHDVLEDTKVSEQELLYSFGSMATNLVLEVTDVSRPEDGNRDARKALDRAHIAEASLTGKAIKLADMTSNTRDIATNGDIGFARMYLREMELTLEVISRDYESFPHLLGGDSKSNQLLRHYSDVHRKARADLDKRVEDAKAALRS